MKSYQNIPAAPEVHQRFKLYGVRHGIPITEVARRAIALLEAQNELPHPANGKPVPVVYQEKESK